jgi:hypothetical protein
VYEYGGVYADLDVTPTKSLSDLLRSGGFIPPLKDRKPGLHDKWHSLAVFHEHDEPVELQAASSTWPLRNGVPELHTRISNFLFYAAESRSEALLNIIYLVVYRLQRVQSLSPQQLAEIQQDSSDYITLYATGPDAFTEAVFGGLSNTLLPHVCFLPNSASFANGGWSSWRDLGKPPTSGTAGS